MYSTSTLPQLTRHSGSVERERDPICPSESLPSSLHSRFERPLAPLHYNSAHGVPSYGSNTSEETLQLTQQHRMNLLRKSEKDKMLSGEPYRHYVDTQLCGDRNDCLARLELFNDACRPSQRANEVDRGRLFLAILKPDSLSRGYRAGDPVGSCGMRTIVEAPFKCEYGYNINIGDDVTIHAGCVMLDPCKISIGNRCIIMPGVTFRGLGAPMDYTLRRGNQGVMYGGPITIEDDCFIDVNVTILPGRTIERGSVVEANTVVDQVGQSFISLADRY